MYTWIDLSSRLAENFTVQENVGRWVGGRVVFVSILSQTSQSLRSIMSVSVPPPAGTAINRRCH